jgi:regulator of replication initiation timing
LKHIAIIAVYVYNISYIVFHSQHFGAFDMPKTEITKKTIAVSIDIGTIQKLKQLARSEGRSVSYMVEQSIVQMTARIEGVDKPTLHGLAHENKALQAELKNLRTAFGIMRERQIHDEVWNSVNDTELKEWGNEARIAYEVGDYGLATEIEDRIRERKEMITDVLQLDDLREVVREKVDEEFDDLLDAAVQKNSEPPEDIDNDDLAEDFLEAKEFTI